MGVDDLIREVQVKSYTSTGFRALLVALHGAGRPGCDVLRHFLGDFIGGHYCFEPDRAVREEEKILGELVSSGDLCYDRDLKIK